MFQQTDFAQLQASDVLTESGQEALRKRIELWIRCETDLTVRAAVMRMCTVGTPEEPPYLFFFRMFLWIYEPRNPQGLRKLPFDPYEYQIDELAVIHRAVQSGVGVVGTKTIIEWLKSRDMGMTWIIIGYFLWDFLFNGGSFHLGSFKEDEVDVLGSILTLFGKFRFALYSLPAWMLPKDLIDKTFLISYDNEQATISGESANPGFGRSKRVKAALLDEFQQWENDRAAFQSISMTCNTILLVGTPLGYGNFYGEIARKKALKNAIVRMVHWKLHPLKGKGLRYINGKPTSDWYEQQVKELPAEVVAAELDLQFEGSLKGPVFASSYGVAHQKKGLQLIPGLPVYRGWDLGGWSAVVFMQLDKNRRLRVYREVVSEGGKLTEIVDEVLRISEELARAGYETRDIGDDWRDWYRFDDAGDPSGATTNKSNQLVPEYEELFEKHDINVDYLFMAAMPTEIRVRARIVQIQNCMQRYIPSDNPENDGPGFWIDVDGCPILDEALRGGYRRKINDTTGGVTDKIEERHPYVDVVDGLGYGVVKLLGVPEQIKREATKRKTEDQLEDEDSDRFAGQGGRRSRC